MGTDKSRNGTEPIGAGARFLITYNTTFWMLFQFKMLYRLTIYCAITGVSTKSSKSKRIRQLFLIKAHHAVDSA